MGRSVDYLETRKDIDGTKLAYYGYSLGCHQGVVMVSMEPRFRAAVLVHCGIPGVREADGTDLLDFAPRFKAPVLLLEGREDFHYPYTSSQLPLFQRLGVPAKDKKMVLHEGGHIGTFSPDTLREVLDWLDRYLGPVR